MLLVHVILIYRCNSIKGQKQLALALASDVWTFSSEGCIGDIGKKQSFSFFSYSCTVLIIRRHLFTCMYVECGDVYVG